MSLLLFSDLHCHQHEQFSTRLANGRNSRFQDCLDIVAQAESICVERKIDYCYFLGDCHDSRTKLDIDVLTTTRQYFKSLSTKVKRLIMMLGNHDAYTKVGNVHSIDSYRDFAHIVDKPEIVPYGGNIACYPWTADIDGMKDWLSKMPNCDLLFIHQGVSEASVGPYDQHVKTEVSLKDLPFDKVRHVCAGDFHKRQFLANGKFHYIGSPLQLTFGERNDSKCFTYFSDDWKLESIETDAPRFHLFETIEEYDANKGNLRPCDFIRVHSTNRVKLEEIKEKNSRVQIVLDNAPDTKKERVKTEVLNSDSALIQEWVEQSKTELDPSVLAEEGLALLLGTD